MKKLTAIGLAAVLATGALTIVPAVAHHTFVMFDSDQQVLTEGVVLQNLFNNPHIEMTIGIQNEEGVWESWWFEGTAATSALGRSVNSGHAREGNAMNGETFQPGDRIQFTYCPLRDGRNGGAVGWVRFVETVDGREVDTEIFYDPSDGGCGGNNAAQENWVRWMEQGFTTSIEGEAWDEANPAPEEEEAAPAA